jgi:hypothetical protein
MKKLIVLLVILAMTIPSAIIATSTKEATVYNPITFHRKAVTVGDPLAFKGGYALETKAIYDLYFNPDNYIGAKPFRPSGFETTLSSSLAEGGAETTLIVNSLTLPDGTSLDDANYGDLLILTVGEGDTEEKIAVSTLNETTLTFTITSRGLEYGRWASSTSNIKQHLPGERVYVSNDDAFLYQQYYSLDGDETATGDTTFSGAITFTGNVVIPDYTSTDETYAANIKYVNDVATSGAANLSTSVKGIAEGATQTEMAAGTNLGSTGAELVLKSQYATSTPTVNGHYLPVSGSNGKLSQNWWDLTDTYAWTGQHTHAATSTFSGTALFTGNAYGAGFTNMEFKTTSGNWVKPSGVSTVRVTVIGGGGNGGTPSSNDIAGGGGGAGGYSMEIIDISATSSINYIVGAIGGASSFGPYLSANGGSNGTGGSTEPAAGGAGGTATGGDINITGQAGVASIVLGVSGVGNYSGAGGSSFWGFGGPPVSLAANTAGNGNAGTGYGSGGSGGIYYGGGGTGGAGTAGLIIIEY